MITAQNDKGSRARKVDGERYRASKLWDKPKAPLLCDNLGIDRGSFERSITDTSRRYEEAARMTDDEIWGKLESGEL